MATQDDHGSSLSATAVAGQDYALASGQPLADASTLVDRANLDAEIGILRMVRETAIKEIHPRLPSGKNYDLGEWINRVDHQCSNGLVDASAERTLVRLLRAATATLLLALVRQTVGDRVRAEDMYRSARRRVSKHVPRAQATTATLQAAIKETDSRVAKYTAFQRADQTSISRHDWQRLVEGCLEYEAACRRLVLTLAEEVAEWDEVRRGQIQTGGAVWGVWLTFATLLVDLVLEHGGKISSAAVAGFNWIAPALVSLWTSASSFFIAHWPWT